jgi:hypothetical protein
MHFAPKTARWSSARAILMRIEELRAWLIRHAINLVTVRTPANAFSWPANRTEGLARLPQSFRGQRDLRLADR